MALHSKLFTKPIIKEFFEDLQAIAPEYLQWSEAEGNLICIQKPVDPSTDHRIVNTVEKVMGLLKLKIKNNECDIHRYPDGRVSYTFTLKGIYDQLNAKPWTRNHINDFAGVNSKKHLHSPK